MRILVIDDDRLFVTLMVHTLKQQGHEVEYTLDGLSGARNFAEKTFDAVVCDLIMPDQDGIATIEEIRFNRPDVAIVAISGGVEKGGSTNWQNLSSAKWLGADAILKKPFAMPALVHAVESAVNAQWSKTASSFG